MATDFADFLAGYLGGAVGILIGNPLDLIKVKLQATSPTPTPRSAGGSSVASNISNIAPPASTAGPTVVNGSFLGHYFPRASTLAAGVAAPVLGYGALNAVLFATYNRSRFSLSPLLDPAQTYDPAQPGLWTEWVAGAIGGLAIWVISTPTELVKCRAQIAAAAETEVQPWREGRASSTPTKVRDSNAGASSWAIARRIFTAEGVRGLYLGGAVTSVRDSVGYGFYFWSYEACRRWMAAVAAEDDGGVGGVGGVGGAGQGAPPLRSIFASETTRTLLAGGVAGVITWASIFPLDVIKTRVQTQPLEYDGANCHSSPRSITGDTAPLLRNTGQEQAQRHVEAAVSKRVGALQVAKEAYSEGGLRIFFRGLAVCSVRAFIVNAVTWAVYEWTMEELGAGRYKRQDAALG